MPRLIWTPESLENIHRLYRFLAEKDINAAKRAVGVIRNGIGVLIDQPNIGRPVEDLPTEFREWLIDFGDSGYVVRYHYYGGDVAILAVRHQKEAGF